MRTKTLLLSAAVGVAGMVAASAQTVYSVNAVGYVNVDVPAGYSIIVNPLETSDNTLAGLLPVGSVPRFSQILKWDAGGFVIYTMGTTGWGAGATATLNPGEGAFINVAAAQTITFIGEVKQGALSIPLASGYSLVGSQVPQAGTTTELALDSALARFDQVLTWNNASGGYNIFSRTATGWSGGNVPSVNVAEGFFVNVGAATSWDRTFSVNN